MNHQKYTVLDLFAGAGGLSCGFNLTHRFSITTAIENNKQMQKTYLRNHPRTKMLSDVMNYNDFSLFNKKYGPFDVVVGGPPCQGFSIANRQHNQMINLNNLLVKQFVNFVIGIQPKVFVMENVKSLGSETQYYILTKEEYLSSVFSDPDLEKREIKVKLPKLFADTYYKDESFSIVDYDFSSLKKKIHLFDRSGDISKVEQFKKNIEKIIPTDPEIQSVLHPLISSYSKPQRGNSTLFETVNYYSIVYEFMKHNSHVDRIEHDHSSTFVVCEAIKVTDYIEARLSPYYHFVSNIYNTALFGVPQLRQRFVMIGERKDLDIDIVLPEETNTIDKSLTVRDAIEDLSLFEPTTNANSPETVVRLNNIEKKHPWNDSKVIHNMIIPKNGELALERFASIKQGENFHNLPAKLKSSYANPLRTQHSVYTRLSYDQPSKTVTNVRKCMWIHPTLNRGISVREAARLQSFPDSFVFEGDKDKQYQQVGNAVPPLFAKAIGTAVATMLDRTNDSSLTSEVKRETS